MFSSNNIGLVTVTLLVLGTCGLATSRQPPWWKVTDGADANSDNNLVQAHNSNIFFKKPEAKPMINDMNGNTGFEQDEGGYETCVANCRVWMTEETNPLCGNDGVTYVNLGHLLCANRCGTDVFSFVTGDC